MKYIKHFIFLMPLLAALLCIKLADINPATTEAVYSRTIFPVISGIISPIPNMIPVSIAPFIIAAVFIIMVAFLCIWVNKIINSQEKIKTIVTGLNILATGVFSVYFLFVITCGPNYYRQTFYQQSGLEVRDSTVEELKEMCEFLINKSNKLSLQIESAPAIKEMSLLCYEGFNQIEQFDFIGDSIVAPKPMLGSEIMSYLNITGFYFSFTGESTINVHTPPLEVPFTMCHELAHARGFMREDEANFIGFLGCISSDDVYLQYSGMISALNNSMNALYVSSHDEYFKLRELYSEKINEDLKTNEIYWQKYNTKIAKVSQSINDVYLKSNNLGDGTRSYGRMVDLLLAYYRSQLPK